jgi:hypothetical protein
MSSSIHGLGTRSDAAQSSTHIGDSQRNGSGSSIDERRVCSRHGHPTRYSPTIDLRTPTGHRIV